MRPLQITIVALQAALAVEAVSWTLHKSCYRNKEDTMDDKELENGIIKGVANAKAWAEASASKIDESLSMIPWKGRATKIALQPLLVGPDNYSKAASDVRDRFKKFADMEGPIGKEGGEHDRYENSEAWTHLEGLDSHHYNFIITCRPEIYKGLDRGNSYNPLPVPFDRVRDTQISDPHDFLTFLREETEFADWTRITADLRIKAATAVDRGTPSGGRLRIPESINFHPLFIEYQRNRGFGDWTQEKLYDVTARDAPARFRAHGGKFELRPVDGLLNDSFTATILHEFFHLTYFGGMSDDTAGAYGWVNNARMRYRKNPDLFSIIGAVINLLHNEGKKYKVSPEGDVRAA